LRFTVNCHRFTLTALTSFNSSFSAVQEHAYATRRFIAIYCASV
jgi:hypothetical protein